MPPIALNISSPIANGDADFKLTLEGGIMADDFSNALAAGNLQSFSDAVNFAAHIGINLSKPRKTVSKANCR